MENTTQATTKTLTKEQLTAMYKAPATQEELEVCAGMPTISEKGFYSLTNTIFLMRQGADVDVFGGFHQWLNAGRAVKKGEKAKWIFTPRVEKDKDTKEEIVKGFRLVAVFAKSQTEEINSTEVEA